MSAFDVDVWDEYSYHSQSKSFTEEEAPFIPPESQVPPDVVDSEEAATKNRCLCCLKCFGIFITVLTAIIVLTLIILIILYYAIVWPDPCLALMPSDSDLPINVGINVQTSEIFVIITKPIKTGLITASPKSARQKRSTGFHICSKPLKGFDTAIIAIVRLLRAHSVNITLTSHSCNWGESIDLDSNDGSLKIYVAGRAKQMQLKIDQILSEIQDDSLLKYANLWLSPEHLRGHSSNMTVTIIDETLVTMEPPLAFAYSNFEAVQIGKVSMLPAHSSKNRCGQRPVVGVKLEDTIFRTAVRAIWHYLLYSFPPMSPVGLASYVTPTDVTFADFSVKARPVFFSNSTFLGIGTKQNAEITFTQMSLKVEEETGHLMARTDILLNISRFSFNTRFAEPRPMTYLAGSVGSAVLDASLDFRVTTTSGSSRPIFYTNNRQSYAKFNLQDVQIASQGTPLFAGNLENLTIHVRNLALLSDPVELGIGAHVMIDLKNCDFVGSQLSPKLDFLNASMGYFFLDTYADINRLTYPSKRFKIKIGKLPNFPALIKFEHANIQSDGSTFNSSLLPDPKLANSQNTGFHIGGELFETRAFARINLTETTQDIFLQMNDVNVTAPVGSRNLSSILRPFEIDILGPGKTKPLPLIAVKLHEIGDLSANATFEVISDRFGNAEAKKLQALSVKMNKIVVGLIQSTMQKAQHIEIPGLVLQLANGSNVTLELKTNLEFQTSLSEIMDIMNAKGSK